jgi:hypothetical protein
MKWVLTGGGAAVLVAAGVVAVAGARSESPSGDEPRAVTPGVPALPSAPRDGFYSPPAALFGQERPCDGQPPERFHEFYFTRAIYSDWGGFGRGGGGSSWRVDYPKADCQFIVVVQRLAGLDMYHDANAIRLDDPEIRRFPFLYALEVGRNGGWSLSDAEAQGLRDYLHAGGFLVIDDFWGSAQWAAFEREMMRVLPGRPIVDLPMDHTLFRIFYTIEEIIQVPSINNWNRSGVTHEQDGYVPHVRGIFDDEGRLMVVINWNTDLGDAWEWAESPFYPLRFSTFAFEMGVNMILYSMTH